MVGLAAALLTGCGGQGTDSGAPTKVVGEAAPVPGDSARDMGKKGSASPSSPSRSHGSDGDAVEGGKKFPGAPGSASAGSSGGRGGSGSQGGSGTTGGTGGGGGGSDSCKTSQLDFSTANGVAEGSILVSLQNTGSAACTLKGFPGVDFQSEAGSLNAERDNVAPPTVSVAPGESTRFTLNYPPNDSGGSGVNISSMVVTPPNETQSQTLPISINLAASNSTASGITVGPVGAGE